MAIKIGNFSVSYSSSSDYDINSGEITIDASGNANSNSYYFDSSGLLSHGGTLWRIPGIAVGGAGDDSYYIGLNEMAIIADGSTSSNDFVYIRDYLQNVINLFSIENRHIYIETYWGASAIVVDGLNSRGSIERVGFYDATINVSTDSMNSLINTYKTAADQTFDQLINNNLFAPQIMGVNSAEEVRSLIDATSEISTSSQMSLNKGQEYKLAGLRDYDGNLHAGSGPDTRDNYKYQGSFDVNNDGQNEAIFTNKDSGRWATLNFDSITGTTNYEEHARGGLTRIVGIYDDPLISVGNANGGFLHDGVTPAPAQFGATGSDRYLVVNGETIDRLALNSQVRFQNDLLNDNLIVKTSGDYDGDGFQEVYWKTNDGNVYLRSLMHADGNIRYANYQSEAQMKDYLTTNGEESIISDIVS